MAAFIVAINFIYNLRLLKFLKENALVGNIPYISSVIVAAGKGSRMNMEQNKQYVPIGGIPVLARTIKTFSECDFIKEIIVVINTDDIDYCKENIVSEYNIIGNIIFVSGGAERQDSVYRGLCQVNNQSDIVIIHDGARPFVSKEIIRSSVDAAINHGGACVGVPVKDTIKRVDDDYIIVDTPSRGNIWSIQTPQTFRYDIIMNAHIIAKEDGFNGTDDSVLVERQGNKVQIVMGSYNNIKITTREDLAFGEIILQNN